MYFKLKFLFPISIISNESAINLHEKLFDFRVNWMMDKYCITFS